MGVFNQSTILFTEEKLFCHGYLNFAFTQNKRFKIDKNLQKLNNTVTTFIIQNSPNDYFWNLLIQILFEVLDTKNL